MGTMKKSERSGSSADTMVLTEENVEAVLQDIRDSLGQMFGYEAENRRIGITGKVDLVEIEGPMVIVAFSGEFWHRRVDVLQRIENFLMSRIPEIAEVMVSDEQMLVDGKNKNIYHERQE